MTAAVKGVGTLLQVGDGASPEVFTTLSEVTSLSGPSIAAEEIEVTNMDSPNGFKEYITGLKDGGTVDFDCNWIKSTSQTQIRDDITAGTTRNYKITFQTSPTTVALFTGLPLSMAFSADPNSAVTASLSVRISGDITWS